MTFAMHAHSLVKVVDEYCQNNSSAYLDLTIKILYSIRKFWGKLCEEGDNLELFKKWWIQWNTITHADECNHPVQLLLMLGAFDLTKLGISIQESDYTTPLINLLNEYMARQMKKILSSFCGTEDTKFIAITLMQKLFGINASNSPQPNPDVMTEEPTLVAVRESCLHWAHIDDHNKDEVLNKFKFTNVIDGVNNMTSPYLKTFHLCLSIQKYLKGNGKTWNELVQDIESIGKTPDSVLQYLSTEMQSVINNNIYHYLKIHDQKHVDLVAKNMFIQSTLCHDSQSRISINQKNVLDSLTFNEMIIDLRMAFYFDACKIKRQKWLDIIGDVTYEQAYKCDENAYTAMIGLHTHGHTKQQFWGLLRAAINNQKKLEIFMSKSNSTVKKCLERL